MEDFNTINDISKFKSAMGTGKMLQNSYCNFRIHPEFRCGGDRRKSVEPVESPGNVHLNRNRLFARVSQSKSAASQFILSDIVFIPVVLRSGSEIYLSAVQLLHLSSHSRIVSVPDCDTVLRKELQILTEGLFYFIKIFVTVQMIRINIQYHCDCRMEMQE